MENLQRENLTTLEEAESFLQLASSMPASEIARTMGVPVSRVRKRIRLLDLPEKVRTAIERGEITIGHADLLVRVPATQIDKALDESRSPRIWNEDEYEPQPLRKLTEWMHHHVKEEVGDPEVVEDYLPGLSADDAEALPTLLKLSRSMMVASKLGRKDHGLIGRGRWVQIGSMAYKPGSSRLTKVKRCEHTVKGVVVHGGPLEVIEVCARPKCPVHRPPRKRQASTAPAGGSRQRPSWEEEERQHREEAERWESEKAGLLKAFADHLADQKLELSLKFLEKCFHLDEGIDALKLAYGRAPTDDDAPLVIVLQVISTWSRESFERAAADWGFKVPKRKPVRKAAPKKPRSARRKKAASGAGARTPRRTPAPQKPTARRSPSMMNTATFDDRAWRGALVQNDAGRVGVPYRIPPSASELLNGFHDYKRMVAWKDDGTHGLADLAHLSPYDPMDDDRV